MESLSEKEKLKLKHQAIKSAQIELQKQNEQRQFDNKEELLDFDEQAEEVDDWSSV